MVYENFEKLNAQYPERDDMSFEEELEYVKDCFDTYENIGFTDTFQTPYEDKAKYNGMRFSVVKRLSYVENDTDLECLPMWRIKFENGEEIDAYPEEICEAEIVRDSVKENHYEQALKEEIDVEKPMKKSKPIERD